MNDELTNNQISEFYPEPDFQEMIEAGIFYGRKKTKTHPRMKLYVFRTYNNIEIINLNKTKEGLERALEFLKEQIRKNSRLPDGQAPILLVGTQPAAEESILQLAKEFNFPAVTNRWLGGTLTNFKVISGRIEYFKKLKREQESGALEKYTKKERLKINQEIQRLTELFSTMENYVSLPNVIIMIDPVIHQTAVREARRLKIPIIALTNTDADPDSIDYPVVGNNKSRKNVIWFLEKAAQAVREAKILPSIPPEENVPPSMNEINEQLAVE